MSAPATVTVPGTVTVTATGGTNLGDDIGFLILSRGTDVRRIPFWFLTSAPKLASERSLPLVRPGLHTGTTAGGQSLVSAYRYPTGGDTPTPDPSASTASTSPASPRTSASSCSPARSRRTSPSTAARTTSPATPALPLDVNPYRATYGLPRKVPGVVLPAHGVYDIVFDSRVAGRRDLHVPLLGERRHAAEATPRVDDGRHRRRRRSTVARASTRRRSSRGSTAKRPTPPTPRQDPHPAPPGTHTLSVTASDYQETKNMEDVPPVLPNTATLPPASWFASRGSLVALRARSSCRQVREVSLDGARELVASSSLTTRRCRRRLGRFAAAGRSPRCGAGAATPPPRAARAPRRATRLRLGSLPKDRRDRTLLRDFGAVTHRLPCLGWLRSFGLRRRQESPPPVTEPPTTTVTKTMATHLLSRRTGLCGLLTVGPRPRQSQAPR